MDEASEAEEGRVRVADSSVKRRTSTPLSCLRGPPTERTYLTAPLPTLPASRYVPPGQSAKFRCNYLMAKSHLILLNLKRMAMPMLIAMILMILSKNLFTSYKLLLDPT